VFPELPEVIRLRDARGERPESAAGIGEFWYEPEVWALPLSPAARVLYAGLCSFLGHREINRKDLRNTLKGHPDTEIARAIEELVRHDLLVADVARGYEIRPVGAFV
jgi:preprotein translocase subunit Sec61beta